MPGTKKRAQKPGFAAASSRQKAGQDQQLRKDARTDRTVQYNRAIVSAPCPYHTINTPIKRRHSRVKTILELLVQDTSRLQVKRPKPDS